MTTVKKIGVLTGGGDAPGLNAVIRAVVKTACNAGITVLGLEDSFDGLIYPEKSRLLEPATSPGFSAWVARSWARSTGAIRSPIRSSRRRGRSTIPIAWSKCSTPTISTR